MTRSLEGRANSRKGIAPRRAARAKAVLVAASMAFAVGGGSAAAAAIDEPEPDADLADATIAIRIIGEDTSHPVAGEAIELSDGADALTARTSSTGWARFPNLEPGTEYVARATAEGVQLETSPIEAPADGGVRVTLTTEEGEETEVQHRPAGEGLVGEGPPGGPARAAGMDGRRPDPREMSGVPRGERGDPPGQLTIRALQGEFSATEANAPKEAVIHLVGYGVDGSVTHEAKEVPEDEGRVVFEGLEIDSSRTYYAISVYERGDVTDRLLSQPITMLPQVGVRLMLAGPAPDSGEPPVDEVLEQIGATEHALPGGEVAARFMSDMVDVRHLELVEVSGDSGARSVARSALGRAQPLPSDVEGEFTRASDGDADLSDREVRVHVSGQGQDLPDASVTLLPEGAEGDDANVARAETGRDGYATFEDLPAGERYRAVARVHGRPLESSAFSVPAEGGVELRLVTTWRAAQMLEARFSDVPTGADKVYAIRARTEDGVFRSVPFQLTEERGAALPVVAVGEVLLRFHLGGQIDDERIWFDAQFALQNPTTAPIMPGGDSSVTIPLPEGFVGANVAEGSEGQVRTSSEGFVVQGPLGPGQKSFQGQFAIETSGGAFEFDMPLPYRVWNSQMFIQKWEGMDLILPDVEGMQRDTRTLGDNEFAILRGINIDPQHRLVIAGEGLPERSRLFRYLKWAAGALGLSLLMWGVVGLFLARPGEGVQERRVELERQRDRLLDELADLERQHRRGEVPESRYARSKENLRLELENLYAELGVGGGGEQKAS